MVVVIVEVLVVIIILINNNNKIIILLTIETSKQNTHTQYIVHNFVATIHLTSHTTL